VPLLDAESQTDPKAVTISLPERKTDFTFDEYCHPRGSSLFAANTHSQIYHLVTVQPRTAKTVCGLRVAMIIEPEPVSAALHLVSHEPPGYSSCAHCRRLSAPQLIADWQLPIDD
jgi:hypothetical protein